MKAIESIEQWHALAAKLAANGYTLWQLQYDTRSPEGFHAWFSKTGTNQNYEIVTHSDAVHDAIVRYK